MSKNEWMHIWYKNSEKVVLKIEKIEKGYSDIILFQSFNKIGFNSLNCYL